MSDKNLKNNKEEILEEIRCRRMTFNKLPEEFQKDEDIIIECIKNNVSLINRWKNNKKVATGVLKDRGILFEFFGSSIKNNKKIVLEMVRANGLNLLYISNRLLKDRDIILEAVKQNGKSLQYVPDKLKEDREIVLEAVKNYGWAFLELKNELENDKEIAIEAIKYDGRLFFNMSDDFQGQKEFLEAFELSKIESWHNGEKEIYKEKMEILNNIREKFFIESSIKVSNMKAKKVKF